MKEIIDTIAAYDALVSRALAVINNAPYWKHVSEPAYARLSVAGAEATLIWPRDETFYDSTTIEEESVTFWASLLLLSDGELAAWKAEQMRLYEKAQAQREADERARRESDERATLSRLQAKYAEKTR